MTTVYDDEVHDGIDDDDDDEVDEVDDAGKPRWMMQRAFLDVLCPT